MRFRRRRRKPWDVEAEQDQNPVMWGRLDDLAGSDARAHERLEAIERRLEAWGEWVALAVVVADRDDLEDFPG